MYVRQNIQTRKDCAEDASMQATIHKKWLIYSSLKQRVKWLLKRIWKSGGRTFNSFVLPKGIEVPALDWVQEALKQLSKVSPYARRHSTSPGSSMTPPWVVLKLSTNTTTFPSLRPSGLNADIQCRCFSPSSTFLYSPKVLSPTHECSQRRSPRDQLFF